MNILLFYVTFIFFVMQISHCAKDGLKNEMIDFKSYAKIPLKVVLPPDPDAVHYVLPSSERTVRNQKIDYHYLCIMKDENLPKPTKYWEFDNTRCLTSIKFEPETEKICENEFTFSIKQQKEEEEKFSDAAVEIFIFAYDVCDGNIFDETVASYQLEIYKVYADPNTKQTLHTEHQILTEEAVDTPNYKIYMKALQLTQYTETLKKLPDAYMKLEPKLKSGKARLSSFFLYFSSKHTEKRKKKKEVYENGDYLIPQMLVPYSHLEPLTARGANLNYLNIRPQYRRLQKRWNDISEQIRYHLLSCQLIRRTKIYTSTSNILKQNGVEVKIDVAYGSEIFQINVPYIWWYLIRTDDGRAIIILLYNIPSDFPQISFLCGSICNDNGWRNIQSNGDRNIYVLCCEPSKEHLKILGFIKSDDIYIKEILNLNDVRQELRTSTPQNEETKSRVSDAEISLVNEKISVPGPETSDANRISSVSNSEFTAANTETSVLDIRKFIDFISNEPLELVRNDIVETKIEFSCTSSYNLSELPLTASKVKGCLEEISDKYCIHIRLIPTPPKITSHTCPIKVFPNIVARKISGADEEYTFQYNVCYHSTRTDVQVKFTETPMLYSVRYDTIEKETIYTVHKISASRLISIDLEVKDYVKQLESYTTGDNLKNMAIEYGKYLDGYKFNDEDIVLQMLVPLTDFDQSYARGANFHVLNFQPQYKRLAGQWDAINRKILQYLLDNELSKDVTIYTGTAVDFPKKKLEIGRIELDENFSIRIPLIWSKIITLNSKSITIVMYNIPRKHYFEREQRLCWDSICTETNWLGIEPPKNGLNYNNVYVQCCETSPFILNYFKLFHVGKELDTRYERLILPKNSAYPSPTPNHSTYPSPIPNNSVYPSPTPRNSVYPSPSPNYAN